MTTSYREFIELVKKNIQEQPIPPKYNPKEWKNISFNCYLYTLRACMNFDYDNYLIAPGFISEKLDEDSYKVKTECILEYLKRDYEALGMNILQSKTDEPVCANEYKIAVYVMDGRDYHFARQDNNGQWSEKNGWKREIEILKNDEVTKDQGDYKFIGIFKVSKKAE